MSSVKAHLNGSVFAMDTLAKNGHTFRRNDSDNFRHKKHTTKSPKNKIRYTRVKKRYTCFSYPEVGLDYPIPFTILECNMCTQEWYASEVEPSRTYTCNVCKQQEISETSTCESESTMGLDSAYDDDFHVGF